MDVKQTLARLAVAAGVMATLAACGAGPGGRSGQALNGSGAARASSVMANPTVSTDLATLENNLSTCLRAHAMSAHPVHNIIACAFPRGDTRTLEAFALQRFTPAVLTTKGPGSARDAWAQAVAAKYLATQQGGASAMPSPTASA